MIVLRLAQRIARSRRGQAVLTRPVPERIASALIRATTLRNPFRFIWRELSGSDALGRYRLRRSGRLVCLRHNTADPIVLQEIFYSGHYVPPNRVANFLEGLGGAPRVLDLGANIGLFGVWVLERFPDAEITAFEPDPSNAAVARCCIAANAVGNRWRLVEAAAASADGRAPFVSGEYLRSRLAPEAGGLEVETVDILPYFKGVDLAKIDIEGGEWAILGDPRFRELDVPVIALEYHSDQAPGRDPQAVALDALAEAGYEAEVVEEFGLDQGMLWAWRPEVSSARS